MLNEQNHTMLLLLKLNLTGQVTNYDDDDDIVLYLPLKHKANSDILALNWFTTKTRLANGKSIGELSQPESNSLQW